MKLPYGLASAFLAVSLCACAFKEENTILLELRYQSDRMPQACSEQAAIAEQNFRRKWSAYLFDPATTTVVQSDAERTKSGPARLAPVGSYPILSGEWTLTNQMVSVFINCEKREGYVRAQGGVTDQKNWYGPFRY